MAIQIKLLNANNPEGRVLQTINLDDITTSDLELRAHIAYNRVRIAMKNHSVELTQPVWKSRPNQIFGGYFADKFGNCVIAE